MTQRALILGADVTIQANGLIMVENALPDPTVTGPCHAQATFACTGDAQGERLNPLAMLPGSTVPAAYVPMCQPCYDHLAASYLAALHQAPQETS